ncbi:MAG: PilZ domain-containing protein [Myxococcota bacterium]
MQTPPRGPRESPDRPRGPRGPRCELLLKVEYESLGQLRSDFLTSLGSGGLFLRTELPLVVGQVLLMNISFPSGFEPLEVKGEVRWTSNGEKYPQGVGVELKDVSAEIKARLDDLVTRALALSSDGAPALSAPPARPLRVVFLETNPILRDLFKFQITRFAAGSSGQPTWDLDLACAASLVELRHLLTTKPPHLLVLDFETQAHSQGDVLAEIRRNERWKKLPIIVLGGPSGEPADDWLMFVKKPFSVKPLFHTLQMLLNS